MENVASFLQYGNGPQELCSTGAIAGRYEPTEAEIKAREIEHKRRQARDLALCTISTAEKLVISGLDVDTAFTKAEELVEKGKLYLASKTESTN